MKVVRRLARAKYDHDPYIDTFWHANCAQIVSVLLEAFSAHHADVAQSESGGVYGGDVSPVAENMHTVCKVLLMLVKYRADHVRTFTDLLASRLCQAAVFAPVAVTLHCEQILMDLAKLDGLRMLRIVTPFARANDVSVKGGFHPNVNLLALHVVAETLKSIPSGQLLMELPGLVAVALPSLSSEVVDLRKAVIFVLVEAYMVVGDALYPLVKDLAPPQKKLLTISEKECTIKEQGQTKTMF